MSVSSAVTRLQALIEAHDPGWIAAPGASDENIRRLRDAVAPLVVPADVETLYRWHDGFALPVLDGYGVQPIESLIAARTVEIDRLDFPPAWLMLSTPPNGGGNRLFATMTTAIDEPYAAIWSMDTHDAGVALMYESLVAAIEAFCDMLREVAPGVTVEMVGATHPEDLPRTPDEYRLARSPGAFAYQKPPAGTESVRFVNPGWPEPWLRSVGTTAGALRAQGDERPISGLISATDPNDFPFRIMGQVDELGGTGESFDFRITDQTGSVWVHSVSRRTLLSPRMRGRFEIDLERLDGHFEAAAIRQAD